MHVVLADKHLCVEFVLKYCCVPNSEDSLSLVHRNYSNDKKVRTVGDGAYFPTSRLVIRK